MRPFYLGSVGNDRAGARCAPLHGCGGLSEGAQEYGGLSEGAQEYGGLSAVSYTHLTLPTILLV